jgi:2-polyprenyl-6-methoxyphenol hydroxylase-like FAD-dependent oxidoreductase
MRGTAVNGCGGAPSGLRNRLPSKWSLFSTRRTIIDVTVARSALIVGAGIGGLAAGVALRRGGWHIRIFERATSLRELGFALLLAPNAVAALRELEVAAPVIAAGVSPTAAEVLRPDGRVLRRIDVSDSHAAIGGVPLVALRPVLHGTLLDAAGRDAVTLGAEASSFSARNGGVSLRFTNGDAVTGDLLVGADGVGSVIRRTIHPGEPPPRPSGLRALRGVVSGTSHHLGPLGGLLYLGRGLESSVVKAADDIVYFYVSLRDDDVAAVPNDPPSFLAYCLRRLDDRFRAITQATRPEDMRVDELLDRDPLPHWGAGPMTLLGDAAHPLLPHTGQGAAQALEDAVALGRVLAQPTDVPRALRRYERVRATRTTRLLRQGRRFARTMRSNNLLLCWARDTAVRLVPKWLIVASFVMGQKVDPYAGLEELP